MSNNIDETLDKRAGVRMFFLRSQIVYCAGFAFYLNNHATSLLTLGIRGFNLSPFYTTLQTFLL